MRTVRRLVHLSRPERRLLLRAALWASAVRVALWVCPFRAAWRLARGLARAPSARPKADRPTPDAAARAVRRVCRYLPRATCLTQALAVYILLGRSGVDCTLRLGVVKTPGGRLLAHAWVEDRGRPLLQERVTVYSVFPDLEGARP